MEIRPSAIRVSAVDGMPASQAFHSKAAAILPSLLACDLAKLADEANRVAPTAADFVSTRCWPLLPPTRSCVGSFFSRTWSDLRMLCTTSDT